jgi:thiol-disulfide isomerase/thioredoxin
MRSPFICARRLHFYGKIKKSLSCSDQNCMETTSVKKPDSSLQAPKAPMETQLRNFLVVVVAIVLSVLIALGLHSRNSQPTLSSLAAAAMPLEQAITNGKPSLVEFYANWCTSCQAMVDDVAALEKEYGDRVNFVMLNVDNSKWLPELMRYRVDGIPHFEFLNNQGKAIATAIGEQPRPILSQALESLVTGKPFPGQQSGQTSELKSGSSAVSADPRSHGASVKPLKS